MASTYVCTYSLLELLNTNIYMKESSPGLWRGGIMHSWRINIHIPCRSLRALHFFLYFPHSAKSCRCICCYYNIAIFSLLLPLPPDWVFSRFQGLIIPQSFWTTKKSSISGFYDSDIVKYSVRLFRTLWLARLVIYTTGGHICVYAV